MTGLSTKQKKLAIIYLSCWGCGGGLGVFVLAGSSWLAWDECWQFLWSLLFQAVFIYELLVFILAYFIFIKDQFNHLH